MTQAIAALIAAFACFFSLAYVAMALKSGSAHFAGRAVVRHNSPVGFWALIAFFGLTVVLSAIVLVQLLQGGQA